MPGFPIPCPQNRDTFMHLGTHLSRQLHCLGMIIICHAERSKASKTSSVTKCNLGTRRMRVLKARRFGTAVLLGAPVGNSTPLFVARTREQGPAARWQSWLR